MRLHFRIFAFVLVVSTNSVAISHASDINAEGHQLESRLDATHVEQLWPAGVSVDWRTGEPDGRVVETEGKHTHCSAFAASIAEKLGIYLLHPPEHSTVLLANAQYDWLAEEGVQQGWRPVRDDFKAQADANHGQLVVAVYRNHRDNKPGHIAIVRPSEKSTSLIQIEGPQITQAGVNNYHSTSLRRGFSDHPAAWSNQEVLYYEHSINWAEIRR